MIKKALIFSLFFFYSLNIQASNILVLLKKNNTVTVKVDKTISKINLGFINGYKIDCNKKYLVVWGIPKKFNDNSPQNNEMIILNLKS